ncbi:hypothetical protein JQ630_28095 [Bradyrhizobium diazoefficiens]|nr:hypothetical protein [Bradyrhizobium diazoefficiens]MBR0981270.1 hypothetical protein [Bradyrhizobium diazoefficiens]
MSEEPDLTAQAPHRGFSINLALATAAASANGLVLWGYRHPPFGDPLWWQGGTLAATLATILFTIEATNARRRMRESATSRTPSPQIMALPAPVPMQTEEEPMPTASTITTAENFVEAERTRLAGAGYTEAEISQILIAKETGGQAGSGGAGQGVLSGVLSNLTGVAGHVRNFLPGLKADFGKMLSPRSSFGTRIEAATVIALKASVIAVLAYLVSLEGALLKANVDRAKAEACIARQKNAINFSTMNELMSGHLNELDRECKGR